MQQVIILPHSSGLVEVFTEEMIDFTFQVDSANQVSFLKPSEESVDREEKNYPYSLFITPQYAKRNLNQG